jgi:DnaJ-class molecular chaperone
MAKKQSTAQASQVAKIVEVKEPKVLPYPQGATSVISSTTETQVCSYCNGSGIREYNAGLIRIVCRKCRGTGKLPVVNKIPET